jgi:RimJ/RimL family protein N-acetyltransferase
MSEELFRGALVRLAAVEPEEMSKAMSRWNLDSEYYRMLDSAPAIFWSAKKVKEWIEKDLEKDPADDMFFSMRALADYRLIGFMSLFDNPAHTGDALVAIAIGEREYWGKGFGTDAMQVMLTYCFNELNYRRLTLIVFEHNPRGVRSYQKSGFVLEGRLRGMMARDGRRWDWFWMGILREEWAARGSGD